jgi:hypothetical protein
LLATALLATALLATALLAAGLLALPRRLRLATGIAGTSRVPAAAWADRRQVRELPIF